MPEPDERLAPAPPEAAPSAEADGIPGWRALAPDLTPLRRHRDYRLLLTGQTVSFLGSMVTYVAVPYQVYRQTGSSLAVGLLGIVEMVALLALAFLGGALADAADRRRLVLLADARRARLLGRAAGQRQSRPAPDLADLCPGRAGRRPERHPAPGSRRPDPPLGRPRRDDRGRRPRRPHPHRGHDRRARLCRVAAGRAGPAGRLRRRRRYLRCLPGRPLGIRAVPPPPDAERPSLRRVVEGER